MARLSLADLRLPAWQEIEESYDSLAQQARERVVVWEYARDSAVWEFPQPLWA
jgi:hypothetical protein